MALTTLDPNTALIVVDLQKGIAAYPFVHPIDEVVERSRALLDAFRERGLPVVLVNVAGGAGRNRQPGDIVVTKRTWGAIDLLATGSA